MAVSKVCPKNLSRTPRDIEDFEASQRHQGLPGRPGDRLQRFPGAIRLELKGFGLMDF